jgi:hypothetical protein
LRGMSSGARVFEVWIKNKAIDLHKLN